MDPPPTLLNGRYQLLEEVGAGGQGQVARATDTRHDRAVALKIYPIGGDDHLARQEARILLSARPHPNLPTVREDFYLDDGRYVLVMDWIEGKNLRAVLDDDGAPGLPYGQVVAFADQMASALEHLHSHSPPIVHGDLKPSNVIRTHDGRIVLVDFGISSQLPGEGSTTGSAGFIPPERLSNEPPTPASDVYSLSATLCVLLRDEVPRLGAQDIFRGLSRRQRHRIRLSIGRGLALDPERRPTASELVSALAPRWRRVLRPKTRRGRVALAASWVGAVVAITSLAYALIVSDDPNADRGPPFLPIAVERPTGISIDEERDLLHVHSEEGRLFHFSLSDRGLTPVGTAVVVPGRQAKISLVPQTGDVVIVQSVTSTSSIDRAIPMNPLVSIAGDERNARVTARLPNDLRCQTVLGACTNAVVVHPQRPVAYVAADQEGLIMQVDLSNNRVENVLYLPATAADVAGLALAGKDTLYACASGTLLQIDLGSREITLLRPSDTKRCLDIAFDSRNERLVVVGEDFTSKAGPTEVWLVDAQGRIDLATPLTDPSTSEAIAPINDIAAVSSDGLIYAIGDNALTVLEIGDGTETCRGPRRAKGPVVRTGDLEIEDARSLAVDGDTLYALSPGGVYRFGEQLTRGALDRGCWTTFTSSDTATRLEQQGWSPLTQRGSLRSAVRDTWTRSGPSSGCPALTFEPSPWHFIDGGARGLPDDGVSGLAFGDPFEKGGCRYCHLGAFGIVATQRPGTAESVVLERRLSDDVTLVLEASSGPEAPRATSQEQIGILTGIADDCSYVVWTSEGSPRIEALVDHLRLV